MCPWTIYCHWIIFRWIHNFRDGHILFNLIVCPWMIYCHWSIFKGSATSEMVTPAFIMPVAQSLSTHCKSGIVNSLRFLVFVNMFTASRNKMMSCSQNNRKWVISFVCIKLLSCDTKKKRRGLWAEELEDRSLRFILCFYLPSKLGGGDGGWLLVPSQQRRHYFRVKHILSFIYFIFLFIFWQG